MGLSALLYRILAVTTVIIVSAFAPLSAIAQEQDALPAEDPTREWRGVEYADAVAAQYYLENPNGKLYIDQNRLSVLNSKSGVPASLFSTATKEARDIEISNRTGKSKSFISKVTDYLKNAFHPGVTSLLSDLEGGEEIQLKMSAEEKFYLERDLRNWILNQKNSSIHPHQLMSQALTLTKGEMITAWAIAWNVTREEWTNAQVRNYGELTEKFVSLTGERHLWQGGGRYLPDSNQQVPDPLPPRDPRKKDTSVEVMKFAVSKRGDEFSYLYHRIGVELFSMLTSQMSGSSLVGTILGKVGALGEYLKYTKTAGLRGESKKRVGNDIKAADSGARLYKYARSGRKPAPELADANRYLRSNSGKFNKDYQLPDDRTPHLFKVAGDPAQWTGPMSVDELTRLFYYANRVNMAALNPMLLDGNGDLERLMTGLANYEASKDKNPTLDTLLREWQKQRGSERVFYHSPKVVDFSVDMELGLKFVSQYRSGQDYIDMHERILRQVDRALVGAGPIRCNSVLSL